MNLSIFLAQVDFLTPMVFRISAAAQLARRLRQDGLKHARCPNAFAFGFPQCSSSIG
jgi:hypothetical protein